MLRVTVLYPNESGATFDWEYYQTSHMALLEERWGPHMARKPEVARGQAALPKGDATYMASAVAYFDDREALQAAMRAGGSDIPNDIPQFTNVQPVMQVDELVQ